MAPTIPTSQTQVDRPRKIRKKLIGNDADTTGAVYGQIAGAYYGFPGIPEIHLTKQTRSDFLTQYFGKVKVVRLIFIRYQDKPFDGNIIIMGIKSQGE
jgi:hypothetical protein